MDQLIYNFVCFLFSKYKIYSIKFIKFCTFQNSVSPHILRRRVVTLRTGCTLIKIGINDGFI